jgi:hypothetical protein
VLLRKGTTQAIAAARDLIGSQRKP